MELIHEGFLERCLHISETKKEWKRGYFILKKNPHNGSSTLEYFKDANWKKQEPKGVCNLFAGYTVKLVNETKKKYMFELTTVDKTYQLYSNSESGRQKWWDVLNEGATTFKMYNVVLLDSPPNAYQLVKNIRGTSQLQIGESAVTLLSNGVPSISWKFATIRRYKSQNGAFILEVGRKSFTGEGVFKFDTVNPVELFEVLDKAVKDRMKFRGIESGSKPTEVSNKKGAEGNSPKTRSNSDQSQMGKSQAEPNEYSHLGSIRSKQAAMKSEQNINDYDTLFATNDRLVQSRKSDPVVWDPTKKLPAFANSSTLLTSNSVVPPVQEEYMVMSAEEKDNITKPRPLPPPRAKAERSKQVDDNNTKAVSVLQKTSSVDENTYDILSTHTDNRISDPVAVGEYDQLSSAVCEYDQLFVDKVKSNVPYNSEYNHLNQTQNNNNEKNRDENPDLPNSESYYDQPKVPVIKPKESIIKPKESLIKPKETVNKPNASVRKSPLKPARHAPAPPSRRVPSATSTNSNNNIILKLQRNLESSGFNPSQGKPAMTTTPLDSEQVYDTPNSPTAIEGYNQVGDMITGEYRNLTDSDGYVTVPNDKGSDAIYQTPRGESPQ